jgi:uncharacterized protein with ParB-like and HNH nuclease domain
MDKFLNPEEFNIDEVFKGKYNIPIYQRPYSWRKEEVCQLLRDIQNSYCLYKKSTDNGEKINNEELLLFAGTLFIKTERNVKNTYVEYDIVDGQQRITTFTLILMVILNHLYLEGSDDDSVKEIENYLWKKVDRKREKSYRVLTLGNIDKNILIELFDTLFSKNDIICYSENKMTENINYVERNLLENLLVIKEYFKSFKTEDEYYDYFEYIKFNIRFIAIEVHTNLVKLFSIFESINSKGKPLEEIDLIKSFIFQNINESDYDEYLKKWGKLIIKTNDNLMDYLTIYIRANISYYRNSIKLLNFKSLVENAFTQYYNSSSIRDIMIRFIDDMLDNVKYYNMLSDVTLLENSGISRKAIVYFMMNNIAEYNNTKAFYFKLLLLKEKNKLSDEIFEKLIEYAFKFILTFQSVSSRESKQTLGTFIEIQNEIYKEITTYNDKRNLSEVTFDNIMYLFNKKITDNSISVETLRNDIKNNITYRRNKKVVKVILSYLEYQTMDGAIDFNKLYWLLKAGKDIHVDHILPLNPKESDLNFKYYVQEDSIVLKEGQDFILNTYSDKVGKEDFYDDFLHVIGNLRLEWADENIKKSNHFIVIKEYDNTFNTSSQISTRTSTLIKQIINSKLLLSTNIIGDINKNSTTQELYKIKEYNSDFRYQDYKPVSFRFLGENYILERYNYTHLLVKILDVLYDIENEKFKSIANKKYSPMKSNKVYISTNKDDIREPYTLEGGIYVEQNLSSAYIIKFIYILVKEIGLNYDDLMICLKVK